MGLWVLLDEVPRQERAAAQVEADNGRAGSEDVEAALAARLEGATRRSWWRAIDDAVRDADVQRAGVETEAEAEVEAETAGAAAGGAGRGAAAGAEGSQLTPPTPVPSPGVAGAGWATSCIDGFVVTPALAARMRSGGYKEALSGRRIKHLSPTASYAVIKPAVTEGRVLGLRLGDMPSGYTLPDGTKVPPGWEVFAGELEVALRSELASRIASGAASQAGLVEGEAEEEEATQLPSGRVPGEAVAEVRGADTSEEATQRQPSPPSPPLPPPPLPPLRPL